MHVFKGSFVTKKLIMNQDFTSQKPKPLFFHGQDLKVLHFQRLLHVYFPSVRLIDQLLRQLAHEGFFEVLVCEARVGFLHIKVN